MRTLGFLLAQSVLRDAKCRCFLPERPWLGFICGWLAKPHCFVILLYITALGDMRHMFDYLVL